MRIHVPSAVAAAAFAVVSASAFGAANSPVLAVANAVSVNRVAASAGATLRNGDVLQTTASGTATVNLGAARASFGHLTLASFEANELRLSHGYVHVTGSLNVADGAYTVSALSAKADYEMITLAGGRSYVHVFAGSVHLAGLAQPMDVAAGEAVTFQTQAGAAGAGQAGAGAGAGAGAAAGGAAAAGAVAGATGAVVVSVVAVAAVAVATGVVVATQASSSPTQP